MIFLWIDFIEKLKLYKNGCLKIILLIKTSIIVIFIDQSINRCKYYMRKIGMTKKEKTFLVDLGFNLRKIRNKKRMDIGVF